MNFRHQTPAAVYICYILSLEYNRQLRSVYHLLVARLLLLNVNGRGQLLPSSCCGNRTVLTVAGADYAAVLTENILPVQVCVTCTGDHTRVVLEYY